MSKVYAAIYLQDGNKLLGISLTEKGAFSLIDEDISFYGDFSLKKRNKMLVDYEIRIVYGLDTSKPIYGLTSLNYAIFDKTQFLTNDITKIRNGLTNPIKLE